jgi:hypothetical protein
MHPKDIPSQSQYLIKVEDINPNKYKLTNTVRFNSPVKISWCLPLAHYILGRTYWRLCLDVDINNIVISGGFVVKALSNNYGSGYDFKSDAGHYDTDIDIFLYGVDLIPAIESLINNFTNIFPKCKILKRTHAISIITSKCPSLLNLWCYLTPDLKYDKKAITEQFKMYYRRERKNNQQLKYHLNEIDRITKQYCFEKDIMAHKMQKSFTFTPYVPNKYVPKLSGFGQFALCREVSFDKPKLDSDAEDNEAED